MNECEEWNQIISKLIKTERMHKSISLGIDFLVRKSSANKEVSLIYARITIDGQSKEISIKEKIKTKDWDGKTETVRGRTIETKSINDHINSVRYRLREKFRLLEDSGKLITADSLKDAYLGVQSSQKGRKLKQLIAYHKEIWTLKLKPGGLKNYKTTFAYIELFLEAKFNGADVFLSQINTEFATDFEHYIRTNPIKAHDPCKGNGVGKHIQRFKRILNWAEELKWIERNPCEKYRCPIKKTRRKKLSIQQLVAIEQQKFSDPALHFLKELFLNSCYTGFAFAEAMALQESHFEWEPDGMVWCKIYRAKSEELCAVPMLPSASKILNKYRLEAKQCGRQTIFPSIANQTVNIRLKIIQGICGIDIPLSFHVARHTFAKTVALKNGVPLETVQMMMGHTKISTTQIYADVDEEKILVDTALVEEKLDSKRRIILNDPRGSIVKQIESKTHND